MTDLALENPQGVTKADIVVGIPSFNEVRNIGFIAEQVSAGLAAHFPGVPAVIVNCDNASGDNTREAFFAAKCDTPRIYVSTPQGIRGKGNNLRNLFKTVVELKAQAGIVVDADLASITPRWIKCLVEPLFSDYGYVTPIYLRHKYDGLLTNNLAYPLSRCLFGRRVRQPIGGDFGFSGELAGHFLENDTWTEAVAHYGIDMWMTTLAMYFRKPITQAYLGTPKIHRVIDPSGTGAEHFKQIVLTLFNLQERYASFWKDVKRSRPTAIFGFGLGETAVPPPVNVDAGALYAKLEKGAGEWGDMWAEVLSPATRAKVLEMMEMGDRHFEMPTQLWATCLFDFAVSYRDRIADADTLMNALAPLYYGKALSFIRATEGMGMQTAEDYIEEQCLAFEEAKPYLVEKWG